MLESWRGNRERGKGNENEERTHHQPKRQRKRHYKAHLDSKSREEIFGELSKMQQEEKD